MSSSSQLHASCQLPCTLNALLARLQIGGFVMLPPVILSMLRQGVGAAQVGRWALFDRSACEAMRQVAALAAPLARRRGHAVRISACCCSLPPLLRLPQAEAVKHLGLTHESKALGQYAKV